MRDMWSESLVGSFFSSAERPLWLHFKTCITLLYFFPPEHLSGADLPEAGFTVLLENKHASGRGDKVPDAQHARRGKYSLPLNVCLIWKITFWLNFRFDALGRLFFFFFFCSRELRVCTHHPLKMFAVWDLYATVYFLFILGGRIALVLPGVYVCAERKQKS